MRSAVRAIVLVASLLVPLSAQADKSEKIERAGKADAGTEAAQWADRAEALSASITASSHRVQTELRRARLSKRARAIACFDEALSRVNVSARAARMEASGAREAARNDDGETAREHLSRVIRLREMVRGAVSEADQCAGLVVVPPEGTQVRLIVDPRVAPYSP